MYVLIMSVLLNGQLKESEIHTFKTLEACIKELREYATVSMYDRSTYTCEKVSDRSKKW